MRTSSGWWMWAPIFLFILVWLVWLHCPLQGFPFEVQELLCSGDESWQQPGLFFCLKHGNQFVICATNRPDQDLYVVFDYMELDADSFSWPSFIVICVPSGWFAVTVATVCHKGPTCRRLSWATCTCPSCLRKIVECKSLHPTLQD